MKANDDHSPLFDIRCLGKYMSDAIFLCDRDGVILYVNEENEKLTGIKKSQSVGKNARDMIDDFHINNSITIDTLSTGKPQIALSYVDKAGIQLLSTGSPIYDETGALLGVMVVDKDITKTMQLTENLAVSQDKRMPLKDAYKYHDVIQLLNQQNDPAADNDEIEWKSAPMKLLEQQLLYAAKSDATVLLTGKTGAGKEVAANKINKNSKRFDMPFIKVNCAAIPEALIESELFGYVRGAFTGADPKGKLGAFELANGGTLMLDEIGELPLAIQAKLLRVLQEQTITRVGGTKEIELDVRIIAATNRDLGEMISEGRFREDLYYRLNVLPIQIPSLQERKEDITTLLEYFLKNYNAKYRKHIILDRSALYGLSQYPWPGNIRELQNTIERFCVIHEPYTVLTWSMINGEFAAVGERANTQISYENKTLAEITDAMERDVLMWGLMTHGTTRALASELGVHHSTIVRKIQKLGIQHDEKP